jgi:hypothetical protein
VCFIGTVEHRMLIRGRLEARHSKRTQDAEPDGP